ncbi:MULTISPECIES: endo alpha-1,4 polygalactosaminidase [unclassified Streptomyces]|uniref:endo alpha-1,4 polygalactosaminidase n=1 Tax=unclassified Streptomyces TaxID=2593676 RepID=UPI00225A91DF|nr:MULTISPECIES: endo alpha-1,4 polygalactosaminidase [unclassified Streptomyces]MCX4525525.1 endo alpha-1,4 polygalactosaminidase [Streptomyces sp. NBC_01551]MCX4544003.1 endo alpha-1,4 polygalactosaminidase [Streptomyces sp. NBC_01565]
MKRFSVLLAGALLVVLGGLAACTAVPAEDEDPGPDPAPGERWLPRPGTAWQWQLTGKLDTSVKVPVYDVDGFHTTKEQVAGLRKAGRKTICYISTGAWEDFRPDADAFPESMLGKGNGWEGERWLDIRRLDELERLMGKRFDMCRDKGFDAVEPDNMDAYRNESGFPVTAEDQLRFNRLIAKMAHDRGLSVGLKNDLDQIPQLVGDFDFAVNEQCAQYEECELLTPFIEADKAVFHVEYELPTSRFCAGTRKLKLSSLEKKLELGPWRKACPRP